MRWLAPVTMVVVAVLLADCNRGVYDRVPVPNPRAIGNPDHGAELVQYFGCGSCHTIEGIPNANGVVGPSLDGFAYRVYIAGKLPNTPDNLESWIQGPQRIVPGNAMPDAGIDRSDAKDIAAYLYTRR